MIDFLLTSHEFYVLARILCVCTKNLCKHKYFSGMLILVYNAFCAQNTLNESYLGLVRFITCNNQPDIMTNAASSTKQPTPHRISY